MEVIAVIVASVAALGAIVWKVVTRKEGTTLPGITKFDPKRIPIMVLYDEELPVELLTATEEAVDFWNWSVSRELFSMELSNDGSTMVVMPFSGHETSRRKKSAIAYVDLTLTDDCTTIKSASVKVDYGKIAGMTPSMLMLVMAHEFGHVLGLEHDDERGSIMYSKALARGAFVTPLDKRLILGEYGLV